jgi:hypothetical protein
MKMTAKKETIFTYSGLSASLLLCLLAIFGLILSSCSRENVYGSGRVITEQRTVSAFEDVLLEGSLEVQLKQGLNAPVSIEAEDNLMRHIETTVSGTTLRVKIRNGVNLKHFKPIRVYLESEKYRKVVFSGSGSLASYGNDTIKSTLFSYEINGSADARLKVAANEVEIRVDGSGDIAVDGKSGNYSAVINGSGNIRAAGLETADARVEINGSGEQQIWVTHLLEARISGSGNIRYKGSPTTVNSSVSGSGKISKL